MEIIYAVQNTHTRVVYVGRTRRTLTARWAEHLESAAKGAEKVLYEYLRHDPTGFHIIELDGTETASEAVWLEAFHADGWQVLNEIGGNRETPKKRDTEKERAWREMNVNAEAALNRAVQAVPNPNRLNEILAEVRSRVGSSWERFAAANPDYVAAIGTDKSLRLNNGSAT